jgi:hypothetical protein
MWRGVVQLRNEQFSIYAVKLSSYAARNLAILAVMAEWLRRWTRNPMGYSRAGSNPVHSEAGIFIPPNRNKRVWRADDARGAVLEYAHDAYLAALVCYLQ